MALLGDLKGLKERVAASEEQRESLRERLARRDEVRQ
jgi:hypothetical protein